ncbi:MAG: hypothetical protein HY673_18610 [Chloroflexi bacterium]|nr:hypothetical protein [Chloroflexota bacterium]
MKFRIPLWAWMAGGIAVIGGINMALWLPHFVTADAKYCLTCHATGETPDKELGSRVHPDYARVSCVDCHAKPGQRIVVEGYRGGFSATPAFVSKNCGSCHQDIIRADQQGFQFNELDIRIDHEKHVTKLGAQCTDCHRNVAHEYSVEPTNRPLMEYCNKCHSKAESCSSCHPSGLPKAKTVLGKNVPLIPAGELPPVIKHPVGGRASCSTCHGANVAGLPSMPSDHKGRDNTSCSACHLEQKESLATPAKAPPVIKHPLEGRSSCSACHGANIPGLPSMPADHQGRDNPSCTLCHSS